MAMIRCRECGNDVSDRAAACLKCGAPVPRKTTTGTWVILVLIIVTAVTVTVSNSSTNSTPPQSASSNVPNDPDALKKFNELTRKTMGKNLYTSYEVHGTTAIIRLNPSLWNRLSTSEQRQLCDLLGRGTFMQAMGLEVARLEVVATHVGNVVRSSGSQSFEPRLKSLE